MVLSIGLDEKLSYDTDALEGVDLERAALEEVDTLDRHTFEIATLVVKVAGQHYLQQAEDSGESADGVLRLAQGMAAVQILATLEKLADLVETAGQFR